LPRGRCGKAIHQGQLDVIDYLKEENRVLREQLGGRRLRLTNDQRRRLAATGAAAPRGASRRPDPGTLLRWYRALIAKKYDGTARGRAGRPPSAAGVQQLVVRFASENPSWGTTRIRGALRHWH
jgi:putative transposase